MRSKQPLILRTFIFAFSSLFVSLLYISLYMNINPKPKLAYDFQRLQSHRKNYMSFTLVSFFMSLESLQPIPMMYAHFFSGFALSFFSRVPYSSKVSLALALQSAITSLLSTPHYWEPFVLCAYTHVLLCFTLFSYFPRSSVSFVPFLV